MKRIIFKHKNTAAFIAAVINIYSTYILLIVTLLYDLFIYYLCYILFTQFIVHYLELLSLSSFIYS